MEKNDMVAGIAEQFMTDWTSNVFRERCVAQIESVRNQTKPQASSSDPMEKFLGQKTSKQLEEFIFDKCKSREDYVSLIAELLMMLRQHPGKQSLDCAANGVDDVKDTDGAHQ